MRWIDAWGFGSGRPPPDMNLVDEVSWGWERKRRRRLVIRVAIAVASVTAIITILVTLHLQRMAGRLDAASELFARGTGHLSAAQALLASNLDEDDDDPATVSAIALVRAHDVVMNGREPSAARETLVWAQDYESPELEVARGLIAAVDSDFDAAFEHAQRALASPSNFAPGIAPWFRGWLQIQGGSIGAPESSSTSDSPLQANVEAPELQARALQGSRLPRLSAARQFRRGHHDSALETLAKARTDYPDARGLTVDHTLYRAFIQRAPDEVAASADLLLADSELPAPERAAVSLARAAARFSNGDRTGARADFSAALEALVAWDGRTRDLALEIGLRHGEVEAVQSWLEAHTERLPAAGQAWVAAMGALMQGRADESLELVERLEAKSGPGPGPGPGRAAYLRGLALVELGRFADAVAFLREADKALPNRVELRVALARVRAHTGDPSGARDRLLVLSKSHPWARRVHTGLGESYRALARADPLDDAQRKQTRNKAVQAFEAAVQREPLPATAHFNLAELARQSRPTHRPFDAASVAQTREHYEAAVRLAPQRSEHAQALGLYLAELGFEAAAQQQLEACADKYEGLRLQTPLTLIELAIERTIGFGYLEKPRRSEWKKIAASVEAWLEQAEKLGADATQLARLRAEISLAGRHRSGAARALEAIAPLLESNPQDIEAQVIAVRSRARTEGTRVALEAAADSLSAVPRTERAPLYLLATTLAAKAPKAKDRRAAPRHAWSGWRALERRPRSPAEHFAAARLVTEIFGDRRANRSKTLAVLRNLTRRYEHHPQAWLFRGQLELELGDSRAACKSADKAAELAPNEPSVHALLGRCALANGDHETAEQALGEALRRSPDRKERRAIRKLLRSI